MTEPTMHVADATTVLREEAGDAIAVLTMSPMASWGEARPLDFRLLGTMGAAGSIGLGIALGTPDRPVWVVDGDGSLLMQLGVVAAVADAAPENYVHVVIDNGIYAISGAQPTPAPRDWAALLEGAGYREAVVCETPDEVRAAIRRDVPGPRAVVVRCARERPAYAPGALAAVPEAEAARIRDRLEVARV
jgi:thiamine pyrophosphate-dependent acetolactate synthase large subunit-like protein